MIADVRVLPATTPAPKVKAWGGGTPDSWTSRSPGSQGASRSPATDGEGKVNLWAYALGLSDGEGHPSSLQPKALWSE